MKEKEKKYGLFKAIAVMILVAILLTWLIPNGSLGSSGYLSEGTLSRVGLNDIAWLAYYGIYFNIDRILLLLAIGGLYGVLSKTSAYDKLVTGIAKKFNKRVGVVVFSILVAVLTSVLTQSLVVLIFIPFIISILNRMNVDKLSILATTFGSMIVGTMGATLGTEGAIYLDRYLSVGLTTNMLIKVGILAIGLILFNFFTLTHMRKIEKDRFESADMFAVEKTDNKVEEKKGKSIIPIVVIGILLFALVFINYFDWKGLFNITIFEKWHKAITEVTIGSDFKIFGALLGANMPNLGAWDLFTMAAIILITTILFALCYRVKLNEFITNFASGMKKFLKPIGILFAAWVLLTIVYMSPYVATILNKFLGMTDKFNLFTMIITAFISSVFHTDLGFSGFVAGEFIVAEYADYIKPISIIFTTIYGLVQFFLPTSVLLGMGLTSLDVKYGDWLKHIWKFLLGMFICLLVIFILITII